MYAKYLPVQKMLTCRGKDFLSSWTSAAAQDTANNKALRIQVRDTNMAPGDNMAHSQNSTDHRHPSWPLLVAVPQNQLGPLWAAQATHFDMVPEAAWLRDIYMVSGDGTD